MSPARFRTRLDARHEQRRQRELEAAREAGLLDAPALWLLPRHQRRSWLRLRSGDVTSLEQKYQDRIEVKQSPTDSHVVLYPFTWSLPFALVNPAKPRLASFPPAFSAGLEAISSVYVFGWWTFSWLLDPPTAASGQDRGRGPERVRLVADWTDLTRWRAASWAYTDELDAVDRDLHEYWRDNGRAMRLDRRGREAWPGRRAWRAWRARLTEAYDRLRAASEQYRPTFDEIAEAVDESARAYQEVTIRFRRLAKWERRRIWCLVRQGDGFLIVRDDIGGGIRGCDAGNLSQIHRQAADERYRNLHPVDWDESSIRACDAELAALAGDPEIGRSRSGRPMAVDPATSFASWFDARIKPLDPHFRGGYQSISDRDRLAVDSERWAQARANRHERDRRNRPIGGGGGWPTAWGVGQDSGSHGGDSGGGSSLGTSF